MSDPPTAPTLAELERISARGWRGLVEEPLGDWVLRAGGGFTGRANSVLGLGDPGVAVDQALGVVAAFYARHALPPLFQVPFEGAPEQSALTSALLARGWRAFNETQVLVAAVPPASASAGLPPGWVVEHAATPSRLWLTGYHYRGRPLPANAVDVLVNADGPTFVTATEHGSLLGVARGIVTDGWLGVTAVTVQPDQRRRGVGSVLMGALQRWAAACGARWTYLQVDAANVAALAMYGRAGFVEHHRYHYVGRPDPAPPA